jgi:hypothetical protein
VLVDSRERRSRLKTDSIRALNAMTPVQTMNEKYSSFVFSEFVVV